MPDNPLAVDPVDPVLGQAIDPGNRLGGIVTNLFKGVGQNIVDLARVPGDVWQGKYTLGQIQDMTPGYAVDLALAGAGVPKPPGALGAFSAWHGTPHLFSAEEGAPFGAFKDEAIGSGEGAQAYGWGHYVAGNPKVAENYQTVGGHILEVHVKPEEEELLDWDRTLGNQSPDIKEKIKDIMENKYRPSSFKNWDFSVATGRDLYDDISRALGASIFSYDRQGASKLLHEAGIPGIKYLDANSRTAGEGTRNYVIFDPSNLEIRGRDGQRLEPVDYNPFEASK